MNVQTEIDILTAEIERLRGAHTKAQRATEALSVKNKHLVTELANMTKAQGNLYRFQENVERQRTIYAQIAEIAHQFNQSLDFEGVLEGVHRFVVDHLNFERCVLVLRNLDTDHYYVRSHAGYYAELKARIQSVKFDLLPDELRPLAAGKPKVVFTEGQAEPSVIKRSLCIDEYVLYSLGLDGERRLRGFLAIGNSKEHFAHHLRLNVEDEMDALFSNITSLLVGAQNTVTFTEETQAESAQVKRLLNNMKQAVFCVDANGMVVEPVSKFASEIFPSDFANKCVFKTLYGGIEKGTEAFASLNTIFITVFGEGELQWELLGDDLPHRIIYQPEDDPTISKVLKIAYAPIWSEEETLDRLMLVIEDVTEIEKLESQISEKQTGIRVIQEIAMNEVASLNRNFFDRTSHLFDLCMKTAFERNDRVLDFGTILRNLHTIKGNARMYGFTGVSTAVHEGEGKLMDLKDRSLRGENLDKIKSDLSLLLHSIRSELVRYGSVASRVFALQNKFAHGEDQLRNGERRQKFKEVLEENFLALKDALARAESGEGTLVEARKALNRLFDVPVIPEFRRLNPMIQEVSANLGKVIELRIIDSGVKLDRFYLDKLQDAFIHLVRNSIDHGIEVPDERLRNGKPPSGIIEICCEQRLADVALTLRDDGAGIDIDRICAIALAKGFVTKDQVRMMTDQEKLEIILLAGFSSKESATELSGRGVGMDFVKDVVASIGGELELKTKPGHGASFTIRFTPTFQYDFPTCDAPTHVEG